MRSASSQTVQEAENQKKKRVERGNGDELTQLEETHRKSTKKKKRFDRQNKDALPPTGSGENRQDIRQKKQGRKTRAYRREVFQLK
jgi:hypothetical protein